MTFLQAMTVEAISNLRTAPLRTSLALIGVAIGCAAVVAILQIGFIAEQQILRQLEKAGLNLVRVSPTFSTQRPGEEAPPLSASAADIEAELERLPSVRQAALLKELSYQLFVDGEAAQVDVVAMTRALLDIVDLKLDAGSFDALDLEGAPIGVIGSGIIAELPRRVTIDVGDYVAVGVDGYRIGGVLAPVAYSSMIGVDFDQSLLIPEESLQRLVQSVADWRLIIEVEPNAPKQVTDKVIETLFRERYGIEIIVRTAETLIDTKQAQQRNLTLLLTALGVVSLIVGMVGVTNVMLASVAERRREIGLRMSIGASPGDIRALFLIEAIVLCVLGGLAGTLTGVIGSNLYASVSLADFTVSYSILLTALVMSTVTGLVAGYYPAQQSSQLDPIEALQSE